jgi:tetratricopeptide (TPR) repeat protein
MKGRLGLGIALVFVLAAGCATTPTAAGSAALRQGRPAEAVAEFEKALAEDPGRVDALIGLGVSQFRLGKYDDAIKSLTDAVTRAPDQAAARLYLALSYVRTRDDAKAQEQLASLHALPLEPRFIALVDETRTLLSAGGVTDPVRTYIVASLDYSAEWARELAETRFALRSAQLAWDPFWGRPGFVIRCRNC